MFHRKRSASASRSVAPPSASAQLAASQAFLANRTSNANLSNAAAAAALRSFTTSPAPVGDVQTKRMVQRQASTSSNGSAAARGLQRRDSGGSMTERTFRTPSPNRPASNNAPNDAPPVPPLPKNYSTHKRAASLEPQTRIMSPVLKIPGGRGASLDRAPPKKIPPQSSLDDIEELERTNSRNSVNFSYPRGARPNSPPVAPIPSHLPKADSIEAAHVQNSISQTAGKPVKKKKKKIAPGSAEGSHLASGGLGGRPHGAEIDGDSNPIKPESKPKPKPKPKPKKRVVLSSGSDSDSTPEKTERRSQRASGQLNKQPSIVREDWEGEQVADLASSPISPPESPPFSRPEKVTANSSKKVESPPPPTTLPATPATPPPEPSEYLNVTESSKPRVPSISPSRSTRFSAQIASEMLGERKHEPPPRSLSPAKPALKHHSPSSQTRSPVDGGGPGGWKRTSQTPSEASDNASLASADGTRKKRAMHVSFGTEPEVVDVADPAQKRSWVGSSKPQHLDTIKAEDDMEEVMKPRPALPSFGSIRGKKEKSDVQPSSTGRLSNLSSSASSSESYLPNTMETSVSSDQAIGHVLAQSRGKQPAPLESAKLDPNLPLPPEVTSVEGTGYLSDNSSVYSNEDLADFPVGTVATISHSEATPIVEPGDLTISTDEPRAKTNFEDVPVIAVQPATPGSGTMPVQDEWLVDVPGGFPESTETSEHGSRRHSQEGKDMTATSPADLGIAEPKPLEAAKAQDINTPGVGTVSQSLLQQTQTESDAESTGGESIYSDAAEDVADLEGDGFGSINAILESPISSPVPKQSPPASPVVAQVTDSRQDSWDQAQAHWKEVADRQRYTATQMAPKLEPIKIPPKSKARKKASELPVAARGPSPPDSPDRPLPISSSLPSIAAQSRSQDAPMRKSMRSSPLEIREAGPMRKSMRSAPPEVHEPEPLRQTMRSPPPGRGSANKSQVAHLPPKSAMRPSPVSPVQAASEKAPKGALQKRSIPAAAPASKPKPLMRMTSNDSDSDSSFKKMRKTKNGDGKYTMRRSMRSPAPVDRPQSANGPPRPLSPETRRPFTSGGQGALRSTMRSSVDSGTPSLRGHNRQRPASSSGFSKRSSAPPASTKFKSRFGNESDDDDSPRLFRSRFEDSSDDEPEPLNLRPVRGIPRKTDEGDSTDLNDSSDDGKNPQKAKVQIASPKVEEGQTVRQPSSGSGRDIAKLAGPPAKKKGLFGRFRSTKDNRVTKPILESPARRDTDIERSPAELTRTRSPAGPGSPTGKLQRRSMPQRVMSESWPLPEKKEEDPDNRPGTSDGVVQGTANGRPLMGPRENTSSTLRTEGGTPVYGRSGKKKRFPMLRKALGLHD